MLFTPEINLPSFPSIPFAELALTRLPYPSSRSFHFSHVLIASVLHLRDQSSRETSSKAFSNHSITVGGPPMAITHLTIRKKENEGNNCSVRVGPLLSVIPDVECLLPVSFLVAQPQAGRGSTDSPGMDQHHQSLLSGVQHD